ncbi:hypothetical protein AAE02nite_01880 [Adhaeribacter aerolatus]|uniref:Uncharacterized protein n=2 Tax=Adhaeribacter aerolatus TaxID=670289 RepID=A0A512AS37_9BACT|nr:hypothetical protein AAE02nite_01880 [Adhaeribacter aerolatus]
MECLDLNNFASDTSYYIKGRHYEGFIFPKEYKPTITTEERRFTPKTNQVQRAEAILLEQERKYGLKYKRQYIGINKDTGDTLVFIRLMKNGFKEECFDKMVNIGFGEYYEKYQKIRTINLTSKK